MINGNRAGLMAALLTVPGGEGLAPLSRERAALPPPEIGRKPPVKKPRIYLGSQLCECGRRISANKSRCFKCEEALSTPLVS